MMKQTSGWLMRILAVAALAISANAVADGITTTARSVPHCPHTAP